MRSITTLLLVDSIHGISELLTLAHLLAPAEKNPTSAEDPLLTAPGWLLCRTLFILRLEYDYPMNGVRYLSIDGFSQFDAKKETPMPLLACIQTNSR